MRELEIQKAKTEAWLRDHPNAAWQSRYDMIQRLAEIESKIKQSNKNESNQKTKIIR
jgi:hypothetical protein